MTATTNAAIKPPSEMRQHGANYWKVGVGPNREFRIDARGLRPAYISVILVGLIFAALVCFIPNIPIEVRFILCAIAMASSAGIATVLLWLDRNEQRLGPYLVVTENTILLRHGRRVAFADCGSFEIVRRGKKDTADGAVRISYLVLRCKSGEEIEILGSWHHRGIVKLQAALVEKMKALATTR